MAFVALQQMPREAGIRHLGEDWTGITDPKERKLRQNRLNKRLSRQRKRDKKNAPSDVSSYYSSSASVSPAAMTYAPPSVPSCTTIDSPGSSPSSVALSDSAFESMFGWCTEETAARKRALLTQFAEQALASYMTADPCADHHLRLIQLNIINAFTKNAAALGFSFDWLICASVSPFGRGENCSKPGSEPDSGPVVSAPNTLMPTSLQSTTRHHPWIDLFPLPKMRDNLLIAISSIKAEEEQRLFDDAFESGGGRDEWAGLVVWREPWDPQSWEVSLPFFRNWGWLLEGCPEIIVSTNYWRSKRGEEPIASPSFVEEAWTETS